MDVNDEAPRFVSAPKSIKVSEKAEIGTVLTKFEATDDDLGMNRVVKFHIFDGNVMDMFVLNADTGVLTLGKSLDFEREQVYNLNVTASDSGHPRLHAWTVCEVRVEDANDNPPSFPNTAIVRQIQEGIPVGTPIVTVTAEDPDSGRNGKVVYSIKAQTPGGDHFGINPNTGIVFTAKPIDREAEDNFRLTVVATDVGEEGETPLSSEKLVTVIGKELLYLSTWRVGKGGKLKNLCAIAVSTIVNDGYVAVKQFLETELLRLVSRTVRLKRVLNVSLSS